MVLCNSLQLLDFSTNLVTWSGIGTFVPETFPSTRIRCRFSCTTRANQRQFRRSEDVRTPYGTGGAGRFSKSREFYRESRQWYVMQMKLEHCPVRWFLGFSHSQMDWWMATWQIKTTKRRGHYKRLWILRKDLECGAAINWSSIRPIALCTCSAVGMASKISAICGVTASNGTVGR